MSIQSSWLCTWTQDRGNTERLSTYNYLTWLSLTEKTTVSLSPATVSSLETIAPAPSKARERWGHLKSWKRIPGSTKHSDKWVPTGSSRLMWWNSWSSLHICERRPCQAVPQDCVERQETHFQVRSRPVSPSPYQTTSKPHIQHVIYRVALYLCDHVVMSCNLSGWSPGCWRSESRWPGWSWGTRWKIVWSIWLNGTLQDLLANTACSRLQCTYNGAY